MTGRNVEVGWQEWENLLIPLRDGRRLAARVWMPERAQRQPVPAILEYLPYRKRDGTAPRDESSYPVFAAAGYAGVRVDISGTGESDGDFDDEYSPRELADGVEVIEWIAAQPWCSGAVGMMGISWGGFNSLQIAALAPPALKAVIAIGTTVDRYNDDIHYKNGCLLYSNFWWSAVMLCFASRPPDPELAGPGWRETWIARLATQPFPLQTWLAHQRRDAYWRHGSICEDYAALRAPALVIGGWGDGYVNAPPAAAANLRGAKAVNGPWIHKYPHFAYPHPRMDFHAEALRWWERWLGGVRNDVESLPAYRAYISENVRPIAWREREPGRWVAEPRWPSPGTTPTRLHPAADGRLHATPDAEARVGVCSPLDCGTAGGEFFTLAPDAEMQSDQRADDAGSLTFDTEVLREPVEILGRPRLRLRVAIDRPLGNIAARLVDVHPDGVGYRVSWGVLNLAHRHGNERPRPLTPGETVTADIALDECGYRFLPGHRLRLSISTAYWPMIMPAPEIVTATLALGEQCWLELPRRAGGDEYPVPEPAEQHPLPDYVMRRPPERARRVERDLLNRRTRYSVLDDTGESEMPGHGLCVRHRHESEWRIDLDDPTSARAHSLQTAWMSRGAWSVRTESESWWRCDATHFHLAARVRAFEDGQRVGERDWETSIARDCL